MFMSSKIEKKTISLSWWVVLPFLTFLISLSTCSTKNLLNAQKFGSIFVNSSPAGGEILLDQTVTGMVTPDTLSDVPVGTHVISINKEGFISTPDSMVISVKENEIDSAEFVLLESTKGSLKVTSNVDGATICIDNKPNTDLTPHVFFNDIPIGTHVISVFKEGYSNDNPAKEIVNIVTEDTAEVYFTLNPAEVGKAVGNITLDFELEDDYHVWHRFYAYRGFVTVINFWATDCPNCMKELPYLQEIDTLYRTDSLKIFGINYHEDFDVIQQTRQNFQLTFTLLRDMDSAVKNSYNLPGTPVTFILDRGGKIYYYLEGFKVSNVGTLKQKLDELFNK
jgi:thiol-disulfide isomerase/thioredoxin